MDKVINYLLNYDVIINLIINTANHTNLYTCAKKMKNEKKIIISDHTYKKFEFFFKDSEDIINDELKSKGINLKIKLT